MELDFYDFVGLAGAFLILFGLYRTTIGTWTNKSFWYELDHLAGASLLVVYLVHTRAYIGIVINLAYALVAFIGLSSLAEWHAKHFKKKKSRR